MAPPAPTGREKLSEDIGPSGSFQAYFRGVYHFRNSGGQMLKAVVGELNSPEIAGRVKHFEAELKDGSFLGSGYADHAKFLDFLGKTVQDFNAGTKNRFKCAADQGAIPADRNGFRQAVHGLAMNIVGEELDRNSNQDAAGAAPLDHCAGTGHSISSPFPATTRKQFRTAGRSRQVLMMRVCFVDKPAG